MFDTNVSTDAFSRVYMGLRGELARAERAPGGQIRVDETAARFGISPTPVREALARLSGERLAPRNAMLFVSCGVLLMAPLMSLPALAESLSMLFSFHLAAVYVCVLLAWTRMRRLPDGRGIRQPVPAFAVWAVMAFLAVTAVGVMADQQAANARLILLGECLAIGAISAYLFRTSLRSSAVKTQGKPQ